MRRDIIYYMSANIIRMVYSIFIMLPLTTFYLSVDEIGVFGYIMLLSSLVMIPMNSGGNLVLNSYYFAVNNEERGELFFHVYLMELLLKVLSFVLVLICGKFFLQLFIDNYKEEYLAVFYLLSLSLLFSSTKSFLYQSFTLSKKSKQFFFYNIIETSFIFFPAVFFLYFLKLGLLGYAFSTLLASILMFVLDICTMKKHMSFSYKKKWINTIYRKGVRLVYANLIENFFNFYDSFVVQKVLNFYDLGLYTHAKQYMSKFRVLEGSFYQSYSVEYLQMLKSKKDFGHEKISLFFFSFLSLTGVLILLFSRDVISFLTHGKLADSAEMLKFIFLVVFFRFNQVQYNQQLLYDKKTEVFVNLSLFVNVIIIVLLTIGMFFNDYINSMSFILFMFLLNFILKNLITKAYAIYRYKKYDKNELYFIISLVSYLFFWKMLG